jgi:hypothetical protein
MGYSACLPSTVTSAAGSMFSVFEDVTSIGIIGAMGATTTGFNTTVNYPGNGKKFAVNAPLKIQISDALTGNLFVTFWGTQEAP